MRTSLILLTLTVALAQNTPNTMAILKRVEERYNSIKTLQASFTTTLKERGRTHTPDKGTLYLSKPNRTRWEYTTPAGDFFLSDNKYTDHDDKSKYVGEREPFRETEDMRIPLAFLIGQLNFVKDFEKFEAKPEAPNSPNTAISLSPKNKKLLFREIRLLVAPDAAILRATVIGQEGSEQDYVLENEQRNPKLPESVFKFTAPPGAQVVEGR